jgi:predicted P-loop ATPase
MVRRAKDPGCKFDHVMVLEGAEDIGKSTVISILSQGPGDEYFSDASILEATDKEQQELTQGVWVYEICELTGIRRAAVEKVKQFISRQSDKSRPAYGHYVVDQKRQCVFIGTTNDQEYLTSQTGNRRWWPVACGDWIDLEGLREARDQLFAEAVALEEEEELFIGAELFEDLRAVHESRRTKDVWEDELAGIDEDWHVSKHNVEGGIELRIHTRTIFEGILQRSFAHVHDYESKRLSQVMQRLGWTKSQTVIRVQGEPKPAMGYIKSIRLLGGSGSVRGVKRSD